MYRNNVADYYLGLDVGTDSVGFAVTDEEYHLQKFRGKSIWGTRLFDMANTATERRTFRSNRRRGKRRTWRIKLLQELFASAIAEVDMGFFQRLRDSALYPEDKREDSKYSIFAEDEYNDQNFFKDYPTIYHLRKALLLEDKSFDIRLVYLAIHHIVKNRGHFLFNLETNEIPTLGYVLQRLQDISLDVCNINFNVDDVAKLADILRDRRIPKRDKQKHILNLISNPSVCDDIKSLKAIAGLMAGSKVGLDELFADSTLKDIDNNKLSLADSGYEDKRLALESDLGDRLGVVDAIKSVYDWAILANILADEEGGTSYISVAKVNQYIRHGQQLQELKQLVKKYAPDEYNSFFRKAVNSSYSSHIGSTKRANKKINVKRGNTDDFYKNIAKLLIKLEKNGADKDTIASIKQSIEEGKYLVRQRTGENGIIPHQLHGIELQKILENASKYHSFLTARDENSISISDKILKLFTFRIPYYVGPLNTHSDKNSWMVRREGNEGRILPWNFEDMVDVEVSAEKFIKRMTNKCTYLMREDVLTKYSLLYQEFMVRNELNNLRINGEKPSRELRELIFKEGFCRYKKMTMKRLLEIIGNEGYRINRDDITGIDGEFKTQLTSYIDFKGILGDNLHSDTVKEMCEQIILWITLYHDDIKMLKRKIRSNFSEKNISESQLKQIIRLNYTGWGRLSAKLLNGIEGINKETGEKTSIIGHLRIGNDNLMQLLGSNYTFIEEIEKANTGLMERTHDYDSLVRDLPTSPAIKRAIWQTLSIVKEICKVRQTPPKRIFVEMARGSEEKKRTVSRKQQLIALYQKIKDEERDWQSELLGIEDSQLRSRRLYLYYTQMGRCMYSGECIDLNNLMNANIYDIDHIYPQSKTKDDSLDNLVLVRKDINAHQKGDKIVPVDIRNKMKGIWRMLKQHGLISTKKYERLTRNTELTDEELAGFINRQLVEVRQSTKLITQLLKEIYPTTEIVCVKAGLVSDFRHEMQDMVKVRSMNDYHHAKDAYLNIVVGNVYHEKFTANPLQWLRENRNKDTGKYHLKHIFRYTLTKAGKTIWQAGEEGTLIVVRRTMARNDILFTRQAIENKGGLFDQNIVSKIDNPTIAINKTQDKHKYGGYKGIVPAYFALIEYDDKGVKQRNIETVPLYMKNRVEKDIGVYLEYCQNNLGLENPRIIIPKILKNSLFKIDGFSMHIKGESGSIGKKRLVMQCAVQLCLDSISVKHLKKIEKFVERYIYSRASVKITDWDDITAEDNLALYQVFIAKHRDTIYKSRKAKQIDTLLKGEEHFKTLSLEGQCLTLMEILHLFQCKPFVADLRSIGGSQYAGNIAIGRKITAESSTLLINQSITGLFEQVIDLKTVEPIRKI